MAQAPLVIVGAGIAGLRSAQSARAAGYRNSIVMLGSEPFLPYSRPQVTKEALTSGSGLIEELADTRHIRDDLGVSLSLSTTATALDLPGRYLTTDRGEQPFSRLVLAAGSRPKPHPWPNMQDRVLTMRGPEDTRRLLGWFAAGDHVLVVGSGLIGSEVASAARQAMVPVTLVDQGTGPLAQSHGAPVAAILSEVHARHGVRLLTNRHVSRLTPRGAGVRAVLSTGERVDAGKLVWATGAAPDTSWLREAGLECDRGVLCRPTMAACGGNDVFVVGDLAQMQVSATEPDYRLSMFQAMATAQSVVAGRNAAEPDPNRWVECTTPPYFWSYWHGELVQGFGWTSGDIRVVFAEDDRALVVYVRRESVVGVIAVNAKASLARVRRMMRSGVAAVQDVLQEMSPRALTN